MGPCPYDHRETRWPATCAARPISLAWGSTGWSVAISRASSPYRSSQDILPSTRCRLRVPARCPSVYRSGLTPLLDQGPCRNTGVFLTKSYENHSRQLNTLQTVALRNHHVMLKRENMVKPHGSLVPVSSTHRCASTPGLSTWSSTRSLQRDYSLGDLISWRVSRLDAFSVSPFRT